VIDHATHSDPAVQRQLDRLDRLRLTTGRYTLDTMREMLSRLGDPQLRLPPVLHVAGTNGKGSTCAFLRAMIEADGQSVHVYTSPHLVRYNERIRVAGSLIGDADLAALLEEVLDMAEPLGPSFFEVTTAAAFLAFARTPAAATILEVGLGGRLDATNVIEHPAACGIAALGRDHEEFLLRPEAGLPADTMARLAFEKGGIARPGTPLVTLSYPESARLELERLVRVAGAPLAMRGAHWHSSTTDLLHYADRHGELVLPRPTLPGRHQSENAALAIAMLRHQDFVSVSDDALARGLSTARWPARLQLLNQGPLAELATGHDLWLDGGHNPSAGEALAQHFADAVGVHLILGMLDRKDPAALTGPLADKIVSLQAVPIPGQESHAATAFGPAARPAESMAEALRAIPPDGLPILIGGSLYLAGDTLRLNGELPD